MGCVGGVTLSKTQVLAYTLRYGRWVMIGKLVGALFGCRHSRYSFPVTIRRATRRPQAAALTGTYVACLDCGKEFPYGWPNWPSTRHELRCRCFVAQRAVLRSSSFNGAFFLLRARPLTWSTRLGY